ncbi:MAG TPA: SDR family NAD(P)-dependent oxidoreductase [Lentimicrobium sp.]|nr:SDR family NAD(P)-dependent oxidoreductase [Lentimicrobium sp.]
MITGTSSGLGEAFAKKAIMNRDKVFCISRKVNHDLKALANNNRSGFWYFEQDLTISSAIPDLIREIFTFIDKSLASEIILINNAGVVEPVKPLGKCTFEEITNHVAINLTAPILLTNEFIKNTLDIDCKKTVINISSGAGSNPYFGWTLYCSTKAGIDMMTRTVGLENDFNKVRILSIAPGVVNTGMQDKLRQVDEKDFPKKNKFVKLYEEEKLTEPDTAATKILEMLEEPLSTGLITDLRKVNQ